MVTVLLEYIDHIYMFVQIIMVTVLLEYMDFDNNYKPCKHFLLCSAGIIPILSQGSLLFSYLLCLKLCWHNQCVPNSGLPILH